MTFLALDTSGTFCVLALAEDDGSIRAVSLFESKRTLSTRLLGEVDGLLTRNGLTLEDMTAFAVGLGPGSFTGVRVGVTTAKTLAQVTGKPLVGVGTLDAYASVWVTHDDDTLVVPVLPSRREEVYAAIYRNGERTEGPFAENVYDMQSRLQAMERIIVCGDARYLSQGRSAGWYGKIMLPQPWTPPEGLARIAARRLENNDIDDPFGLVPLYIVAPSISTPKSVTPLVQEQG
ncbi:MAG: tRNA (adenosine(37)-N6)-threonylcarbamoyltransferase complex dimerization subunit type 1 TsaB [Janthinobacterium lividum]